MRPDVWVSIHKALPDTARVAALDINTRVTNVEVETLALGGFGLARVGTVSPDASQPLIYPSLPDPVDVDTDSRVLITTGGRVLHEGVVQLPTLDRTGFDSLGYGLAAPQWKSLDLGTEDSATSDVVLLAALKQVPWLTIGEVEVSTSRRMWSELRYNQVDEILQAIVEQGNDAVPLMVLVYDDRVVRVVSQVPSSPATYRLGYDPLRMRLTPDKSQIWDAARVVYNDADGNERVSEWRYRDGANRTSSYLKTKTLSVSADTASAALQYLATQLALHSEPIITGEIELSDWDGLTTPTGAVVPGYLVRAGETVEIEGWGKAIIKRTQAGMMDGSARIEVGPPHPRSLRAKLEKHNSAANALRAKRDPLTGNRLRVKRPRVMALP